MTNIFISARIKLTLFYTLTIMAISGAVSGMFYYRTSQVIEIEYARIERRFQEPMRPMMLRIQPEDLERAKHQMVLQLLRINGLIVAVVAVLGYVLSGLTLKPIQDSMEEQKRFVGDAAHELRTPITALKTSIEVNLMDKTLGKETQKILKENLTDVNGLEALTNSLLKLSKISDQKIELNPVNLTNIIDISVKKIIPLARKKDIRLLFYGGANTVIVNGDEHTLIDLFVILLDNAVKYSPQKTVVEIRLTGQTVSIADKGIGISSDDLDHIFDRFYQADSSRSHEGFGLGLSVAQKIVTQHGGSISVKSKVGQGTIFTVSLPKLS
jgi:signal transduction histidine kinase